MTARPVPSPVVTFDLFSALIDSRTGGSTAFDRLAATNGWSVTGWELYDAWDVRNKAAQRDCVTWVPWREPASRALAETFGSFGLQGDPGASLETLVESMALWPLWPDVEAGLPQLEPAHRVGLLSNVDDAIFLRTRAAGLVDREVAFTSERLRAYKPHAAIYRRATDEVGSLVHVATSARDVRGALEAGIAVVRLQRPGHPLDADGPRPHHEVTTMAELPRVVATLL